MDRIMDRCHLSSPHVCVCGSVCVWLQVWEVTSGKCVSSLAGHEDEVLDVCFDYTGHLIATASADGETAFMTCRTCCVTVHTVEPSLEPAV